MGPIGVQEMVIIFLVALVLFGPKKLPELGKTLAKAMTEFRRAQSDLKATFDREMQTIERETASIRDAAHQAVSDINSYSDIDLSGSPSSTLSDTTQTTAHSLENVPADFPETFSTVSASAVPGAESHADSTSSTAYHDDHGTGTGVEGTVPRSAAVTAKAAEVESNPLPEFEQPGSHSTQNSLSELPSIG